MQVVRGAESAATTADPARDPPDRPLTPSPGCPRSRCPPRPPGCPRPVPSPCRSPRLPGARCPLLRAVTADRPACGPVATGGMNVTGERWCGPALRPRRGTGAAGSPEGQRMTAAGPPSAARSPVCRFTVRAGPEPDRRPAISVTCGNARRVARAAGPAPDPPRPGRAHGGPAGAVRTAPPGALRRQTDRPGPSSLTTGVKQGRNTMSGRSWSVVHGVTVGKRERNPLMGNMKRSRRTLKWSAGFS